MPDDDHDHDHDPEDITDPRAMRALAHPVRMALLEVLGAEGTATATRCAEILGETQANCSFHLRMLARYGFVEAAETGDRRERPWRLRSVRQNWAGVQHDVAGAVAADQLTRVFVRRETDRMLRWVATRHDQPQEWQHAAFLGGLLAPMTPGELDDVGRRIAEILAPYVRRLEERTDVPEGARTVRVVATGFPVHLGADGTG